MGQGDSDGTRSRAKIQNMVPLMNSLERGLYEVFGFGTGNQHVGGHPKFELVELLCAAKVLGRNAIAPFLHQS